MDQELIARAHQEVGSEEAAKTFFSIQLQVLKDSGAVCSFLCMPNIFTMAVGLADGRLVLYDLIDLQAFQLAKQSSTINSHGLH